MWPRTQNSSAPTSLYPMIRCRSGSSATIAVSCSISNRCALHDRIPSRSTRTFEVSMVAVGFVEPALASDLALARRLGASVLELFPDWRAQPDPRSARQKVADSGLAIHSAHGCWAAQSIRADRVDLGHPDRAVRRASV